MGHKFTTHRETRAPNGKGSSSEPQTHNILIYETGSQQASAINVPCTLGNTFGAGGRFPYNTALTNIKPVQLWYTLVPDTILDKSLGCEDELGGPWSS